jgi:prepilin-type N-terminal cleavage/methylation domain-containing protein
MAPRRRRTQTGFTLIEILIVMAIIGILMAIAIPGLLRSRLSANEAAAIADVREAGMGAMQHAGTGTPLVCPSPPGSFSAVKSGYLRGCTNGVYWATPITQNKTGIRGFGIDATGRICFTMDGSIPRMNGPCDTLK